MRTLKLKDLFRISKILKKMEFEKCIFNPEASNEEVGAEVLKHIISHLEEAETEVTELLCDITGKKADEIELAEIPNIVKQITGIKDIENFSKQAMALTKSM